MWYGVTGCARVALLWYVVMWFGVLWYGMAG